MSQVGIDHPSITLPRRASNRRFYLIGASNWHFHAVLLDLEQPRTGPLAEE